MPAEHLTKDDDDFEEDTLFDQAGLLTNKIKKHPDCQNAHNNMRITPMKTFALCLAFFGLGISFSVLEPTLLDLQFLAQTDFQQIFYIVVGRSVGYILGLFLGMYLFDRYNRQFLLFLSLLAMTVLLGVLPWCNSLFAYIVITLMLGILMQLLFAGGNVLCLDLWGRQSGPFLQAIHFSLSVGLFVAPLLSNSITAGKTAVTINESSEKVVLNDSLMLAIPASALYSIHFRLPSIQTRHKRSALINDSFLLPDNASIADSLLSNVTVGLSITKDSNETTNDTSDVHQSILTNVTFPLLNSSIVPTNDSTLLASREPNGTAIPSANALKVNATLKPHKPKPDATYGKHLDNHDQWDRDNPNNPQKPKPPPPTQLSATSSSSSTSSSVTSTSLSLITSTINSTNASVSNSSTEFNGTVEADNFTTASPVSPIFSESYKTVNGGARPPSVIFPESVMPTETTTDEVTYNSTDITISNVTDATTVAAIVITRENAELLLTPLASENVTQNSTANNNIEESLTFSVPYTSTMDDNNLVDAKISLTTNANDDISTDPMLISDGLMNVIPQAISESVSGSSTSSNDNRSLEDLKTHVTESTITENNTKALPSSPVSPAYIPTQTSSAILNYANKEANVPHEHNYADQWNKKDSVDEQTTTSTSQRSIAATMDESTTVNCSVLKSQNAGQNVNGTELEQMPSAHSHKKPNTFNNQTEDSQMLLSDLLNRITQLGMTKVHIVYAVMSFIVFLTSLVFLSFLCQNPRELRSKQEEGVKPGVPESKFTSIMVGLTFVFMIFYTIAHIVFSQLYLSLILQQSNHLLHSRGSLLISVFWGIYTFSRATSICCTNGFKPVTMLLLDFGCCIISSATLSIFGSNIESLLWCSVAVMSIGLSSIFPYCLLWLEDYINISNKTMCTVLLGSAAVDLVVSSTLGRPISLSLSAVMYLVLASCIFALLIFGIMWRLATWRGDKYGFSKADTQYHLASQIDEEEDSIEFASGNSSLYLLNGGTHFPLSSWDRKNGNSYIPLQHNNSTWK